MKRCGQGLDTLVKVGRGMPIRTCEEKIRKDMKHLGLAENLIKEQAGVIGFT